MSSTLFGENGDAAALNPPSKSKLSPRPAATKSARGAKLGELATAVGAVLSLHAARNSAATGTTRNFFIPCSLIVKVNRTEPEPLFDSQAISRDGDTRLCEPASRPECPYRRRLSCYNCSPDANIRP